MREAGHPSVIIAEGDEDTRSLLRIWLEAKGYSVAEAADGQEAVALTYGKCPDLILMSERLPKLGGVEATRRIRRRGVECVFPIVAMSTYPTADALAAAITAGCDSFISLPVDLDCLGDLLDSLLHGAAGSRQAAAHAAVAVSH